jgi:hypothetical protein
MSQFHSITSSGRASSVDGIVTPSALAVFKLMTRSNLVGCSTGRLPALDRQRRIAVADFEIKIGYASGSGFAGSAARFINSAKRRRN